MHFVCAVHCCNEGYAQNLHSLPASKICICANTNYQTTNMYMYIFSVLSVFI